MTIDDILQFAADNGYSFEVASKACDILINDRRDGQTFWDERGPRALLEACSPKREYTFQEQIDAQTKRV